MAKCHDRFRSCLERAIDLGGKGRLVAGYDLLLAGLERERAAGTPEQAWRWEMACLRYAERFGPRLDPE